MADNTETSKNQTLRELYYGEDGFQSTANLYKDAKKINNNITFDYVKTWLSKQSIIQTQKVNKTMFNSYVADHPLQQVGIDLADYNKSKDHNDGYSYIFMGICYFSKYLVAYPIKTKQGKDLTEALKKMIEDFSKITKYKIEAIVSDQEGGTNTPQFIRVLNENNIRHIITSTPNGMIERAIKTIKDLIHTRIIGLKLEHERWLDLLPKVVKLYNEKHIHSTINMEPIKALNPSNKIEVFLNIKQKAQYNKVYPNLRENDLVRVAIKKKAISKGHHPKFSEQVYKIIYVQIMSDGTRQYMLNHPNQKPYYRFELRKVEEVEDKDTR